MIFFFGGQYLGYRFIHLLRTMYFTTAYGNNNLKSLIIKDIKNNEKIENKGICFDSIYKNFKEIKNYKLSLEEIKEFISLLSAEDKENFQNHLKSLDTYYLYNYNDIIEFISIVEKKERRSKNPKKEEEIQTLFNEDNQKQELLEIEVNGSNRLNIKEFL